MSHGPSGFGGLYLPIRLPSVGMTPDKDSSPMTSAPAKPTRSRQGSSLGPAHGTSFRRPSAKAVSLASLYSIRSRSPIRCEMRM